MDIIQYLPHELVNEVYQFLPMTVLLWTTKKAYIKYHILVQYLIPKVLHEPYVRDVIRRDNSFILEQLLKESGKKWLSYKKYYYKDTIHQDYFCFLYEFTIQYQSTHCRNSMDDYLKKSRLSKNQHKKKVATNIRWSN